MAAEGYEAITMRRVAQQLGTGPASLYAHLSSKRDLDALIVDRVATEVTVPDPDPARWAEQVIAVMRDLRAAMTRHPGVARAVIGYIPTGAEALLITERLLAIMLAGGVSAQVAAWSCDLLPLYVTAVAYEDSVRPTLDDGSGGSQEEFVAQLRAYYGSLPRRPVPQPGRHRHGADDGRRRGQVRVRPAGAAGGPRRRLGVAAVRLIGSPRAGRRKTRRASPALRRTVGAYDSEHPVRRPARLRAGGSASGPGHRRAG